MRIAMLNITGGGISGGYANYLRYVVPRLAYHQRISALLCAAPAALDLRSWFLPMPTVSFVPCAPYRLLGHRDNIPYRESVKRFAPDVIFLPVERSVRWQGIPLVTMVQNMGPLVPVAGNPWSERMRYVAQRYAARMAVRHADHIIAPTDFVRDFLVQRWQIPSQRITTIPYGSPQMIGTVIAQKPSSIPCEWEGNFVFTAGSIEPYRGLEDLLRAMRAWGGHGEAPPLVIAGRARRNMTGYHRKLMHLVERHGLQERICWAGTLREDEMRWCYRHCRTFVMTSRVESFGVIGLEALASGCVCVVADNPPLPEIFGTAARYYTPGDGVGLAEVMVATHALDDMAVRVVVQRAHERARMFSWDHHVEQLVDVFQAVARLRAS